MGKDPSELEKHFYSSAQMLYIIKEFSEDEDIKAAAETLRNVEQNIRNITAHEIISVDEKTIQKKTGTDAVRIVRNIKLFIEKSIYNMKPEFWNSYSDMNEQIIKSILN